MFKNGKDSSKPTVKACLKCCEAKSQTALLESFALGPNKKSFVDETFSKNWYNIKILLGNQSIMGALSDVKDGAT